MKRFNNKYLIHRKILNNRFKKSNKIIDIKKICLNFSFRDRDNTRAKILSSELLFKILFPNPKVRFSIAKKSNLTLKIKEGDCVGSSIILQKNKDFNLFFWRFGGILFNNPIETDSKLPFHSLSPNSLTIQIKDLFLIEELDFFFDFFMDLPPLEVSFITTSKSYKENLKFFRLIGFPVKGK